MKTVIATCAGLLLLLGSSSPGWSLSPQDNSSVPPATITGSGKPNFIPIWTNSTTLTSSTLFEKSSKVGVGTTTPAATPEVNGTAKFDQAVTFASGQTFPGTVSLGENTFTATQTIGSGDLSITSGSTAGVVNLG